MIARARSWARSAMKAGAPAPESDSAVPSSKPPPDFDLAEVKTLKQAARVFFSQPGPRLIAAQALAAWGARLLLGPPKLTEIPTVGAVVAWWPLQEWLAHKYLLHLEPRDVGGRRFDPLFAKKHRAHHRSPRELGNTLLPLKVIGPAIPVSASIFVVASLGSPRRAVSAMATYATMALLYEWTHYLVHTNYRPKSKLFKKIRRNHRLHHFHNEGYWLGFTFPAVDSLLGTDPDPRSVPTSETARKLHGLDD